MRFRTADEVFENIEGLKNQALLHRPVMPALEKLKQNRELQSGRHGLTKDTQRPYSESTESLDEMEFNVICSHSGLNTVV